MCRPLLRADRVPAGGGLAGLAGCAPQSASSSQGDEANAAPGDSESNVAWDAECDAVVAGYGAAGAYAAISAAESGARVLLTEKADKAHTGGNSRFGQNYRFLISLKDRLFNKYRYEIVF